jgi:hypothetical protein
MGRSFKRETFMRTFDRTFTVYPETDIDGNLRPSPAGSYPDMGACESPLVMRTAPPLDIFGMGVGNRWRYDGIYQGTSPYILDKDYQEILHGTDWLNIDSDGDGLTDGQEDVNANGVVDSGERDPRAKDPAFGPDSANITHSYSPLSANMMLVYTGTGIYAGYGRYYQVMGTEVVDSVNCLKVTIKGHGNNSNPDADTEWHTVWLAQDASGVVWVLKHYDALTETTTDLGKTNAVVWAPATFAVGQRFGEMGDSYREVVETGVTVNLGTGLGSYTDCVKVKWMEGANEDFYYVAFGVGIVKEEWNDGGTTNGWELQDILAVAVADVLVVNFGPAHGLWQYDQAVGWKQWNTVNPSHMVTVDLNGDGTDELVAAFPGYGLYTYDSANGWKLINTVIPEFMGAGRNNRIACDYGAVYGLWLWDLAVGWRQINSVDPEKMIVADIDGDCDDELVAGFSGYGLYSYDVPDVWTLINSVSIHKNHLLRGHGALAPCLFSAVRRTRPHYESNC